MAFGSTPINTGSGANIATDTVSSRIIQRVKLVDGTEGSDVGIPGDADGIFAQITAMPEIDPRHDQCNYGGGPKQVTSLPINITSAGSTVLVTPASGKKIVVLSLWLVSDTDLYMTLLSDTDPVLDQIPVKAFTPLEMEPTRGCVMETQVDDPLGITVDNTDLRGYIVYIEA